MVALAAGLPQPGAAAELRGRAIIVDGDTLEIAYRRVRLFGIDAPEMSQQCLSADEQRYPCGEAARQALERIIAGREVSCVQRGRDRRDAALAVCRAGDLDLAAAMVRSGWAIALWRISLDYVELEEQARAERRGLWRGRFSRPEDFRRGQEP